MNTLLLLLRACLSLDSSKTERIHILFDIFFVQCWIVLSIFVAYLFWIITSFYFSLFLSFSIPIFPCGSFVLQMPHQILGWDYFVLAGFGAYAEVDILDSGLDDEAGA